MHPLSVVVLHSSHHGGLGIVRSLGRLGVPVYCIDTARWEPSFGSRYCRRRFLLDAGVDYSNGALARVLEIGAAIGGHPLLIPTSDQGAIWVAEHALDLGHAYVFPHQDPALIRVLCDKGTMQDLARRSGVPTARSVVPTSTDDLEQFVAQATFPLIVKATDALRFRRYTGGTKFIVRSSRDLFALYSKCKDSDGSNFLVQELIPGEDWMFDGYFDRNSECLFGLTGKKIRRFPAETGITSLGICMRNDTVEKMTREFMKAIGYHGIVDIGYRLDQRDGKYKVLDVNPRIGCTFRLFASADGMDVARALYLSMSGQPVPPAQSAEGRKWIVEDYDLFSALHSLRHRSLTMKDWLRSFRGIQETACFAWDDPLPFLMMAFADFGNLYRWFCFQFQARRQFYVPFNAPGDTSASCWNSD